MHKKVRILHIGKSLSGIDTYIRLIIKYINSNEFESFVICGKGEIKDEFTNNTGKIIKKYEIILKRDFSFFNDILAVIRIVKIIKNEKIKLIHAHSSKGGLVGRLSSWLSGVPVLYTPNAYSYLSSNSKLKRNIYLMYEKLFKSITTHLLACSESEYNRSVLEVGYDKKKCSYWKNSIEKIDFQGSTKDFIIAIGRPSYQKNTAFLVETINLLKYKYNYDAKLKILGVGHFSPDKFKVTQLIRSYDLDRNVELIDWCSRQNTLNELGNSICYVSSSRYEGLSFSNLEALAMGVPIIATNVDGNKDCTIHDNTGYLVAENDFESFAKFVYQLCHNSKLRKSLSENSVLFFDKNFNINNTINNLEDTYKKIYNYRR